MATTSNLQQSWDVFLSFYGKETRRNFTSHLYHALVHAGIKTFRDEPELEKGEEILPGLHKAIRCSKISVVVLSENYASSRWCLDELVEILTSKRANGHVVSPVFYYIDPSDLRHQRGSFGDALDVHKKRYSVDIIERWKSALAEIAELSGYHLRTDGNENESDTVQEIVEHVTPLIFTKHLDVEEYLVGIDSFVEEIYQKLSMESNDVRVIGVCGMGGIGKTTAVKAFYNKYFKNFDISCFVDDVKQHSQGGSYLLPLLQKLSVKIFGRMDYKVPDIESGLRLLKQFLCTKKVLIVLDDLDQSSYSDLLVKLCNLFFAGSRIIFTTRDVNLVNQLKKDISEVDIYMMRVLEQVDSLKLFSYHAFRKPTPPESFKELTVSFITYAGGLPLALKILGSSLLGRTDISFWKDKLVKVRKIGENDIQKILQLSYDELGDETQKEIFLDIAFFFIGRDKDEAVHIFKSCGFFPDVGIRVLVERCLLTITKDNMLQMHNSIRDMGKKVILEESKHGNCRRLYLSPENAHAALQNPEGIQKVEGLIINQNMFIKRHFNAKILERMPNLRLLEIIGANDIEGNFRNSFHELRCIRWRHCPWTRLPSSFRPQKLVSLHMPYSKLVILWKGVKPSVNLKTIDLSYSDNLKVMPDLSNLTLLDKLLLRGCKSLLKVHPSIGQLNNLSHLDLGECSHLKDPTNPIGKLTKLGHLDLGGCVNLKRLPEAIIQLTSLGSLNMSNCRNLTRLPEQLGDMKCLKMLDASFTSIEQLPDSIAQLKGLFKLKLYSCKKLRKLPEQIGNMESLKLFDASYTAIEELPDLVSKLKELDDLNLYSCMKLRKLPEQIGNMESLKYFDASHTTIEELPDSISQLKELDYLKLYDCMKLRKLPEQIGNMESLKLFDASFSAIEHLPDTFAGLVNLEKLFLIGCSKLEQLPEQIGKMRCLEELYVSDTPIEELPNSIGLLSRLQVLDMGRVRNLSSSIWKLSSLARFNIYHTGMDKINLPSTVNDMKLKDLVLRCDSSLCLWLPMILSFPSLEKLTLTFENKSFSPNEPYSLSMLSNLQDLKLHDRTRGECSFPELPLNLTILRIYEYAALEMLPDLSSLKQLKRLYIQGAISLQSLPPLPPHLEELVVYECTSLQDLPDLSTYKELRRLRFKKCSNLKSISLEQSFLQVPRQKSFSSVADIPNRKVAEWFSYKSSGNKLSFTIPPSTGDNMFGVAFWIVYKCKKTDRDKYGSYVRAVITNKTKDIKEDYNMFLRSDPVVGNVQSRVEVTRGLKMRSGDRIKVTFQSLPYDPYKKTMSGDDFIRCGKVKVKMCGVHPVNISELSSDNSCS